MTKVRHPARLAGRMLAALALPILLVACTGGTSSAPLPTIPSLAPETPTPEPTHPGPTYPPDCPREQPDPLGKDQKREVTIKTDKGDMVIEIDGSLSPIAAGNFVTLADCGYYDGVVFHRVVPGFVIQGGDGMFGRSPDIIPDLVGGGGVPYTIKDEPVTTTYKRGTVAMARTMEPDSVTSQFFIVLADEAAKALGDPKYNNYQIIGNVTSGMEVADAITKAADAEKPSDPVVMDKVTVKAP